MNIKTIINLSIKERTVGLIYAEVGLKARNRLPYHSTSKAHMDCDQRGGSIAHLIKKESPISHHFENHDTAILWRSQPASQPFAYQSTCTVLCEVPLFGTPSGSDSCREHIKLSIISIKSIKSSKSINLVNRKHQDERLEAYSTRS